MTASPSNARTIRPRPRPVRGRTDRPEAAQDRRRAKAHGAPRPSIPSLHALQDEALRSFANVQWHSSVDSPGARCANYTRIVASFAPMVMHRQPKMPFHQRRVTPHRCFVTMNKSSGTVRSARGERGTVTSGAAVSARCFNAVAEADLSFRRCVVIARKVTEPRRGDKQAVRAGNNS